MTTVYVLEVPVVAPSFLVKTVNELTTESIMLVITFKIKKFVKPIIDDLGMNENT